MNRRQIKTDNSYLNTKINLRMNHLPDKKSIKVLDCFAGRSRIWEKIKRKSFKNINVVGIDRISYGSTLKGDNVKYLKGMDLDKYDIIDLDAYGHSKHIWQITCKNVRKNRLHKKDDQEMPYYI